MGGLLPAALAAVKHEESPFKALHLIDALLVNCGTVESRRKAFDVDNFVFSAALLRELAAVAENVPRPTKRAKRRRPGEKQRRIRHAD